MPEAAAHIQKTDYSYTQFSTSFGLNTFPLFLSFGVFLVIDFAGIGLGLAGSLILGQIKLLFDFVLASRQLLIPLLVLEVCADLGFQFSSPLVGVGYVTFQPRGAFLKTLYGGLKRAGGAQRRVGHAGAVDVVAAQNDLGVIIERGPEKQIETGKTANANVLPESCLVASQRDERSTHRLRHDC